MDKALYVAMTGARASLQAQSTVSHNLANVDTVGFKAALANTEAFKIQGKGYPSRIDALHVDQGFDRSQGHQKVTGNPLDVSLQQDRWLAVQSPDGSEAYTRNGELGLTANGQLVTANGHAVLDEGGNPMTIPPHQAMEIGSDGSISIIPQGEGPQTMAIVGKMKVVDAPADRLMRRPDGLMRNTSTDPAQAFAVATGKTVNSGMLEGSNVDAAGALVEMIQLQRQFEMQVKIIKNGDDNAQSANSMMRLNG
ncbi:flagellar basal-body rod protein FlgF [Xanthomonas campestris]|uniref:flagellar basal-body rod protein FlgF n=1 Tax=Xanthomonas campestris TaxID=339 RepID=UPI0008A40035|nr:flagellar basal-body rod protein FlgF [Xanthomonas campestris]MEB1151707.1 flagellar basal-body rod protein FlgF [Xanthomonas campestris pv. campestris]MCC5097855.1 flagellar basal-body rod protein FlgF [Xanthomonas campestris]MEA9584061.1 flagellar basal-body rod protein FlgF [Xanthomonas campestris]MEA9592050.1 flagellar basal-body rod protein FlgF [Xanthomonas campestris]MEA9624156.1 flagellar basal-body rod protein FlgF [Xanthomonas campestris]